MKLNEHTASSKEVNIQNNKLFSLVNIKLKLEDGEKVLNTFAEYIERLNPLLTEKYVYETKQLAGVLNTPRDIYKTIYTILGSLIKEIEEYKKLSIEFKNDANRNTHINEHNTSTLQKNTFIFYTNVQQCFNTLAYLADVLNSAHLQAENIGSSDLSETYKLETSDLLQRVLWKYKNFTNKYLNTDQKLIEYLGDLLLQMCVNSANVVQLEQPESKQISILRDCMLHVRSYFHRYKNTVRLYAYFMQKLIDHIEMLSSNDTINNHNEMINNFISDINKLLEHDKDMFLDGFVTNRLNTVTNKNIHHINPALKRFGLIPATNTMHLNQLLEMLLSIKKDINIDLHHYVHKHNVMFVMISRVTYNPIEYNLRTLYDQKIAQMYLQPSEYGITKKIVDRFSIIRDISAVNGNNSSNVGSIVNTNTHKSHIHKSEWHFKYELIGEYSDKISQIYILETLDGNTYRCLTKSINATHTDAQNTKYSVTYDEVSQLIAYITEHNKPNRITNYQSIATKKMINHMFLPKAMSLTALEDISKEFDSQYIRNEIYMKLKIIIEQLIVNSAEHITHNTINSFIHNSQIRDQLMDTLLQMYQTGAKFNDIQHFDGGKFPFSEVLSSFLLDLEVITRRFMKELHDGYNRNTLPHDAFTKHDIKDVTLKRLEQILIKSIETVFSDKENIYSSFNYKYLLLNFH